MHRILFLVFASIASVCASIAMAQTKQPNVVFIIVDDLNDLPYQPNGKPIVPTPHIDRLKAKGVTFTNAHTNDPLCAPSRSSMMFGLYPQTTSLYWFERWQDNGIYKKSTSLESNLGNGGYTTLSAGKIYHGGQEGNFDLFGPRYNFGPWPWDGREESAHGFNSHPQQQFLYEGVDADMDYQWEHVFGPLSDIPDWPSDPANGVPGYKGWTLYGKPWRYVDSEDRDLLGDELIASWVGEMLDREYDQPFALFAGLVKTHTPLYAPDNYFERFPLDTIELPEVDPNDLDDVSAALGNEVLYGFRRYKMLFNHGDRDLYRKWLQAYMACVSFIDDQVGTILDAIEASTYSDETVIFLTSDHGFHVGEKNFLYKGSLWEPSTRIPLIVAGVPGAATGEICEHPVSLIDIYPTFNDLCDLDQDPNRSGNGYSLEGHSLLPLILDPKKGKWTGPDVAITALPGKDHMLHKVYEGSLYPHFSVRSKRYRYSLASDGGEELYDYESDPYEWRNLASHPEYQSIKSDLRKQLKSLRDGGRWQSLNRLESWKPDRGTEAVEGAGGEIRISGDGAIALVSRQTYEHFELELELKASEEFPVRLGYLGGDVVTIPSSQSREAEYSEFQVGGWNRYRIRVHGDRHQVWINNRVFSDLTKKRGENAYGGIHIIRNGNEVFDERIEVTGTDEDRVVRIREGRIRGL